MTTHTHTETRPYEKCFTCGHPQYRHDRIVRTPSGGRMHQGCEVGWARAGFNTSAGTHCDCDAFTRKQESTFGSPTAHWQDDIITSPNFGK